MRLVLLVAGVVVIMLAGVSISLRWLNPAQPAVAQLLKDSDVYP